MKKYLVTKEIYYDDMLDSDWKYFVSLDPKLLDVTTIDDNGRVMIDANQVVEYGENPHNASEIIVFENGTTLDITLDEEAMKHLKPL